MGRPRLKVDLGNIYGFMENFRAKVHPGRLGFLGIIRVLVEPRIWFLG